MRIPKILILSSADSGPNRQTNDHFVAQLNQQFCDDFTVDWVHYNDLQIVLSSGAVQISLLANDTPLSDYDFVYFKSYYRYCEVAVVVAAYLQKENVPFVCSELTSYISFSKLSQYVKLASAGLPFPKTVFLSHQQLAARHDRVVAQLGSPFICKAIDGKGGDANFLINSAEDLQTKLSAWPDAEFVCQQYIANDSDLRVLILGDKIELVIERRRQSAHTHLNNTSQGAAARELPVDSLSADVQNLVLTTARIMDREVAGVDVMFEAGSGKVYILEINASPQVASGAITDKKIEKYGNFFKNMLQLANTKHKGNN